LTAVAIIGAVIAFLIANPIPLLILILPTVIYEVYRTQGESTKWASWLLLVIVAAEIILV
jgi:hypothetical protein